MNAENAAFEAEVPRCAHGGTQLDSLPPWAGISTLEGK